MQNLVNWTDVIVAVAGVLAASAIALLIKKLFRKYRRPNGKKGGVVSFHVAIAFAIVTVVAITTKDPFLTGLVMVLGYLIARNRVQDGQHYMYQVIIGGIIGILVPFSIFYVYNKKFGSPKVDTVREYYDDKPEKAKDDRHEVDKYDPGSKIEDDFEL